MTDSSPEENDSESLDQRHKREKKELQKTHTTLKHAISKTDKKAKKELTSKIEAEIAALTLKHEDELKSALNKIGLHNKDELASVDCTEDGKNAESHNQKPSRAQKRREAKEQLSREQERVLNETELLAANSARTKEIEELESLLAKRNLKMMEIPSDGDCLYSSVAHQLLMKGSGKTDVSTLRKQVANTIRKNPVDFTPYLNDSKELDQYCGEIENTKVWGGDLELKALTMALKKQIVVLQADGSEILYSEGKREKDDHLIIVFLKYALNAGAHYNSTEPLL